MCFSDHQRTEADLWHDLLPKHWVGWFTVNAHAWDEVISELYLCYVNSKKSGKVKTAYKREYVNVGCDVDFDFGRSCIHGAAVLGYEGWLAGYQMTFDTAKSKWLAATSQSDTKLETSSCTLMFKRCTICAALAVSHYLVIYYYLFM